MNALDDFVAWLAGYSYVDRNSRLPADLQLQYHSRSDEHSKKLGELIVNDLLATCKAIREQAARGEIAFAINHRYLWPNGKSKTLDLAIGIPQPRKPPPEGKGMNRLGNKERFTQLLMSCEEKALMTEHNKSLPRIYSELNDSHTIVHQGDRNTIAAGITMLNIANTFISPLRQSPGNPIQITKHNQPHVTERAIAHLRSLPMRQSIDEVGLDAYCTFVVEVDNQGHVTLHTTSPAPQPGDTDNYTTFLERICRSYTVHYSNLQNLPEHVGLTVEESLMTLAEEYPGLLENTGDLAVREGLAGAEELQLILRTLEHQVNPDNDEPAKEA